MLVFKDIQMLSDYHRATFLKLWDTFEGQIITTISKAALLDFTNPQMHALIKSSIVDFPSYYQNNHVYRKMVEHTVNYLKPYYGEQKVDIEKYMNDIFTMSHIKSDILLNKEIA